MKNPGVTKLLRIVLIAGLAAASAAAQDVHGIKSGGVTPVAGGKYPVGVVMAGVCEYGTRADGVRVAVVHSFFQRMFQGQWSNLGELPRQGSENCTETLENPGTYRLKVFNPDGEKLIKIIGPFEVLSQPERDPLPRANTCTDSAARVIDVSTASGAPDSGTFGLAGKYLYEGQEISAVRENVEVSFGDGTWMRMTKGTTYRLDKCPRHGMMARFYLKEGTLWIYDVSRMTNPDKEAPIMMTPTQIALGIRGTTYLISYRDGLETVYVDEGSVWLQRLSGTRLVGKRWIVNAGQTATVGHSGDPVVQRIGKSVPCLSIESPANKTITHDATITVEGTVTDTFGVWSLEVNGEKVAVDEGGAWKTSVKLHPGVNTITATATNLAGISSSASTTVTLPAPS